MKTKTILLVAAVAMLVATVRFLCHPQPVAGPRAATIAKPRPYIIAERYAPALKESELDFKKEDFSFEKVVQYFSDDVIDAHTYNFLQYLDNLFANPDSDRPGDQVAEIREYLLAQLPREQAEKMSQLYGLYLEYQLNLQGKLKEQGVPASPQEALDNLADLQDYRRAVFGDDTADRLFGASVEAQEYAIRRNAILYDAHLYAAEKVAQLKVLDQEMWGDELEGGDGSGAYDRYHEQLQLYKKDLAEMRTDAERQVFLEYLTAERSIPEQKMRHEETAGSPVEEKRREAVRVHLGQLAP